ncbi:ribonuclease-3 family protein [Leuconostocaceae bacterium R-53105]|uniref:Mini-ribonuclease 3 n=2 Tax=Convivina intestini TaxID=1505726 RepID=A0A2U1D7V8_9LACO|nr:ribonuclease-3 family protein [Convivina intestini]CAH1853429.1 Mini-ribonuclease 3 [Convivina intestini]CAH1854908.1 Mini-ribonuclease 3 [Convivina intestini]SDB92820.1 ribonuclease-3 family protein [Leuconostocaceae bacterium R-53105]
MRIIKDMQNLDYEQMNGLSLAYIGDAIYELAVRQHLLGLGLTKVNDLQRHSRHYVSAKAHAALYQLMDQQQILQDQELLYFKRGRNAKSHTKAKNTDVVSYRISTGIEALFGYLYLSNQSDRLQELMEWIYIQVETGEASYE